MGFFDFLSSPAQDPTMLDERGGVKKAKKQFEQDPSLGEMPKESGSSTGSLKVEKPEDFQGKRARLSEEIVKLAADIQIESLAASMQSKQDPRFPKPIQLPDRAAVENRFRADPSKAAEILTQDYGERHSTIRSPKVQKLYDLIVEYKRGERSPAGLDHRAALEPKVDESQISAIQQEIKQLQGEKAKLAEILPDAASELHAAELKDRMKVLESAEQVKAKRLADLQSTIERQKFPGGKPIVSLDQSEEQGRPVDGSIEFYKDLDTAFRSAGVPRRDIVNGVNEGVEALGRAMGPDFDPMGQVDFKFALPYAVQAMGPEAQVTFSEWMRQVKEKEAGGNTTQGGAPEGDEAAGPEQSRQAMIMENMRQQRMARADLANAQELQSWPAIVAFVLLGMLIGPQGAFAFFSNARKKNELRLWLQQLEMERKYMMDEAEYEREREAEVKKEAARRLQRKEDTYEQRQWELGRMMLQHRLMIERSERKQNPETGIMKKLSADFNRATAMAAKFSKTKDDIYADPAAKADAKRNFDFYIRRAAELDAHLRELGADYLDEPDEEVDE